MPTMIGVALFDGGTTDPVGTAPAQQNTES
jgi:hypothetical protein